MEHTYLSFRIWHSKDSELGNDVCTNVVWSAAVASREGWLSTTFVDVGAAGSGNMLNDADFCRRRLPHYCTVVAKDSSSCTPKISVSLRKFAHMRRILAVSCYILHTQSMHIYNYQSSASVEFKFH